ncbi:AAA family ATPase [Paraclostridium bifermentans]|uniref:3'-5' exonuclease n=1 Tax=Paraclostridium bifermentans TaxID=1490 RepID=UPI001F41D73C|nr:3'-5' exonuclease [Paraclostridium bifermentans]MCE9674400.1 AAA family ATPase [Paraclostridium bifermentans]
MLRGKQQEILNLPYIGHGVVCGVAGSGKSFCAIKRAEFIQEVTEKRVLILSYNNSLINYMQDISGIQTSNIDFKTYHKFATKCMRNLGKLSNNDILQHNYEKEKMINTAIDNVIQRDGKVSTLERRSFIIDEINWMESFGSLSREIYNEIERSGRGGANLRKADRKYVFNVYEEYINIRNSEGYRYDWDDLAYHLNAYLEIEDIEPEYGCIIIDEGQDFSPMMIKSLVNYIKDSGSILYLGDRGQQIYGKGNMSWKNLGLKIRKVYTLDENHRNSKQIEKLANSIRENLNLDIEDGLVSVNSQREGSKPKVISFIDEYEEKKYIVNLAKEYTGKGSTCIVLRSNSDVNEFTKLLNLNSIYPTKIDRYTTEFNTDNGIFVGNYHSVKGLEFDNVIIAKCSNSMLENIEGIEDVSEEDINSYVKEYEISLAKLIYVAVSRAKNNLIITHTGEVLEIIPNEKEICEFYKE